MGELLQIARHIDIIQSFGRTRGVGKYPLLYSVALDSGSDWSYAHSMYFYIPLDWFGRSTSDMAGWTLYNPRGAGPYVKDVAWSRVFARVRVRGL